MAKWPIAWKARWIWCDPPPLTILPIAPANLPPRETWNRFCYLRRTFELPTVPDGALARVTADSRFVLYLNGAEVARGPARSVPARLSYLDLNLGPHLRTGENVIAALVRFYGLPGPWWIPAAASYQLGFGSFAFEAPALGIVSDASWKGRTAPYRSHVGDSRGLATVPIEDLDGADVPRGWTEPGFDDSDWKHATELSAGTLAVNRVAIPVEPYTAPEPADIAPLTAIPVAFEEISRRRAISVEADDPRDAYPSPDTAIGDRGDTMVVTYDGGAITLATPWVAVCGSRGAIVDLYVGEDLRSDGTAEIRPRFYATRYRLAGAGPERVEGFEAVGFRYLTVVARRGVELHSAGATERRYPRSGEASFASDDERLNALWKVGARTLDLCSTDAFVDCPFREQRAWLGDSYIHSILTYVTSTDWRLVRRHLRIAAHSQRADGLLAMVAAGDFAISSTTIPDFSLHWVRALARYMEYSGDFDTVRELLPVAATVLDAFERYRAADGLIRRMPGWIFLDWAMTGRAEVVAALDALYTAALNDFAWTSEILGNKAAADDTRRRAAMSRNAFEALWDEARGVYVDAADERGRRLRVSQQTNAAAIISGCAPKARWSRMLDYVLDEGRIRITPTIADQPSAYFSNRMSPSEYMAFDEQQHVVAAKPFFSHFVHQAVVRAGRRDLIPGLCMRWWPQVERGGSAFEEYWEGPVGNASRCHAWAATPTYDLTTHVLGVRPTRSGYEKAEIRPRFGTLTRLQGRVPTPRGLIEVDLDCERGGRIVIPGGVTAEVSFEDAQLRGGMLGPGRHDIARAAG